EGCGAGAKASGPATHEAAIRPRRRAGRCSTVYWRVGRTWSGPLSEIVISGEFARGPFSDYVSTLINAVVVAAEEKLGLDTVALDVRELIDAFDALVVTSGRNDRQVRALAEEIERFVELTLDVKPIRVEGFFEGEW